MQAQKTYSKKIVAKGVLNHNQKWFKASAIKNSEHGDRYGLFLLRQTRYRQVITSPVTEAYSEPSQTSKMELFAKTVKN